MSISPPSDIVLDVARAVDPAKLQAATEKLARIAAAGTAQNNDFSDVLGAAQAAAESRAASSPVVDMFDLRHRMPAADLSAATPGGRPASAYQGLEAVVLQSFIGYMLPQNADSFFGEGSAGEMWRSLLAEQLATQMAKTGKIGLAKTFAAHAHAAQGDQPIPKTAAADPRAIPGAAAQSAAAVLSDLSARLGAPDIAQRAMPRGPLLRASRTRT